MSRHLPAISGKDLIRALRKSGFVVLRQTVVMFHWKNEQWQVTGGRLFRCTGKFARVR